MIELSFKNINDGAFHQGVSKLANFSGFAPKQAYAIGRIADSIGSHTRQAQVEYKKLMDKYSQKDENGKTVQTNQPPFFAIAEGMKAEDFQKEHNEFLAISISVDKWNKIPLSSLPANVGLSAVELKAIEPILDLEEDSNVIPIK
jgi:hypothetical protein